MDLAGRPVILRVLERVDAAQTVDQAVVATTTNAADHPLESAVKKAGWTCVRGSEADVLDRYRVAADSASADVIVRVTGDCPLHDPRVIDEVVGHFRSQGVDYASNVHPPSFPDGLDVEVFTRDALERAWKEARRPSEREHVTPYIWSHREAFRHANVSHMPDLSGHRWTLDTPNDLAFVRAVYDALHKEGKIFGMEDVLALLRRRPELSALNRDATRNEGYAKSLREDEARKRPGG